MCNKYNYRSYTLFILTVYNRTPKCVVLVCAFFIYHFSLPIKIKIRSIIKKLKDKDLSFQANHIGRKLYSKLPKY